jgi:N-acetylmuramoyl-L-alanine amidase
VIRTTLLLLLLATLAAHAAKLSPLSPTPDWSSLEPYQHTITRQDFTHLLESVYAPRQAWRDTITIADDHATIATRPGSPPFTLHFAPTRSSARAIPRTWRSRDEILASSPRRKNKPLAGLVIALDPGHIGGKWARMEERWFQIGRSKPVTEGDMTLLVAKLLAQRLEHLGARVHLTRSRNHPTTRLRPHKLLTHAANSLREKKRTPTQRALQLESERIFYRAAEIRARADLVNEKLKPDLVIALHFNAEPWGNPAKPSLVSANHLHFLVTGAWSADELALEDQRLDMLHKLLSRSFHEELATTRSLARATARATGLPPFIYKSNNAVKVSDSDYIWGRNLLANRLFRCPVIYAEPYVMNSRHVFQRIQLGDYKGTKTLHGKPLPSIYREYADALATGLATHYSQRP